MILRWLGENVSIPRWLVLLMGVCLIVLGLRMMAGAQCVVDIPITDTHRDGWTNSGNSYTWSGDTSADCHDHEIEDETFYAFDMTPLGGGTPISAELHEWITMKWLPNPIHLRADYYAWPYPQGTQAQWKAAYSVVQPVAIKDIDAATLTLDAWNVLPLDDISGIKTTGNTLMRVGCDPAQTVIYSEVDFASFDSVPTGHTPFLRITYTGGKCPDNRTPVVPVTPVPTVPAGGITISCPNGVAIGATCTVIAP